MILKFALFSCSRLRQAISRPNKFERQNNEILCAQIIIIFGVENSILTIARPLLASKRRSASNAFCGGLDYVNMRGKLMQIVNRAPNKQSIL